MKKQSAVQKKIMGRVMHEFKDGALKTKARKKVVSRRQAIAIGLRESGSSKDASRDQNKRALRRTLKKSRRRHSLKNDMVTPQ